MALGRHVFQNLQNRLVQSYQQQPLDLDHIEFLCVNASTLVCSLSAHINVPSVVGLFDLVLVIFKNRFNICHSYVSYNVNFTV